jgi:hypothetical protein
MSDKLEIQNLGKESKCEIIGEEYMPQPPFRLCLVGSSHSGKSNCIKNLITRPEFGYSKHFGKNIFIISKTLLLVGNSGRTERTIYLIHLTPVRRMFIYSIFRLRESSQRAQTWG